MQTAQFELHAEIEDRHWWFVARRRILAEVVRGVLPPDPTTTILDVGCGAGGNAAALAGDYRCLGIDASPVAIDLARQRFPGVKFLCGLAPQDVPPEILAATRLVMLNDVLEHVRDDYALLSTLIAAMAPGTFFLLTVPAGPELWSPHDESFGHFRRYRSADFRALWADLPVKTRLASHFNSRLYPLIWAIRRWNRWRGFTAGSAGTDFSLPPAWLNRCLTSVFAGEGRRLASMVDRSAGAGYAPGVSLVALLRARAGRDGAAIEARGRCGGSFRSHVEQLSHRRARRRLNCEKRRPLLHWRQFGRYNGQNLAPASDLLAINECGRRRAVGAKK